MVLGLLGTLSGAALGILVCATANAAHIGLPKALQLFLMSETLHFVVEPGAVVSAVTFITLCTTVISLVPSFLAARLKPVTAMHHIG
jgi:ABC-type lipoprotein release transport system permease subunit